jgi:hypothetical protein
MLADGNVIIPKGSYHSVLRPDSVLLVWERSVEFFFRLSLIKSYARVSIRPECIYGGVKNEVFVICKS